MRLRAMKTIYRNAKVWRSGRFGEADVTVADGRIVAVGEAADGGAESIDLRGLCIVPGLVDVHVHLREPGF